MHHQTAQSAHADTFTRDCLPPAEQWPELVGQNLYRCPETFNCAAALLDAAIAGGYADRPLLVSDRGCLSYGEVLQQVDRLANVLVGQHGLRPGERVLLGGPNTPMLAIAWLAIVKAGGVVVCTMALLRAAELAVIADRALPRLAMCDAALREEYIDALERSASLQTLMTFNRGDLEAAMASSPDSFDAVVTAADDVCLIAFTSGTTGGPKGCMHFHRDVMTICRSVGNEFLQLDINDVVIGSPPLAFTFGLGGLLLFPMSVGAAVVMLERPSPENLSLAIDEYQATVCFTAPTAYRAMLLNDPQRRFSSLRMAVSAGEALPLTTFEAWQQRTGLALVNGIGATELLHIFIGAAGDDIRPGATGRPLPGWEAKVIDAEGCELPFGEPGMLAVRGPIGCRYMLDNRQTNYVRNGWNITGDTFIRDVDGYFWFQSRADDMIVSAGYNIAGPEVEDALMKHDLVREVAVVASPDAERGSIVKAFVVLKDDAIGDATLVATLQQHVKQVIAPFKYPRAIEFTDALPKTNTGKIQRFKLRQREFAGNV